MNKASTVEELSDAAVICRDRFFGHATDDDKPYYTDIRFGRKGQVIGFALIKVCHRCKYVVRQNFKVYKGRIVRDGTPKRNYSDTDHYLSSGGRFDQDEIRFEAFRRFYS